MRFNRLLNLGLAAFLACGIAPPAFAAGTSVGTPFRDIASSFAKADIAALYAKGIVGGTSVETFSPKRGVTRAEFAALLIRLFGLEPVASRISSFIDVPLGAWYYGSTEAASQLGIVNGTGAGAFRPAASLTREQAAVLLARALKLEGYGGGESSSYEDADDISVWAVASAQVATEAGLIEGDSEGHFRPQDALTREETAALLNRIVRNDEWADGLEREPEMGLQLGWQYLQTTAEFIASVKRSTVNTLVPRVFFLESASAVSDSTDETLVRWADESGKQVWGMVGNRSDAELAHRLLEDESNRQDVIDQLVAYVDHYGMDGLNLDFENVLPKDRFGLTAFVEELACRLHRIGAVLSVNVSPDLGSDWTAAFDYAALGEAADYIVLMGYDEHWGGSPVAGSVASLPWVASGLDTLHEAVPASRTILALPTYTRKWTLAPSVTSTILSIREQAAAVESLGAGSRSWDETIGQYVYTFAKSGTTYKIWAEDSRSLALKTAEAAKRGMAGLAYWYIGGETPDIWPAVRNAAKYASFASG